MINSTIETKNVQRLNRGARLQCSTELTFPKTQMRGLLEEGDLASVTAPMYSAGMKKYERLHLGESFTVCANPVSMEEDGNTNAPLRAVEVHFAELKGIFAPKPRIASAFAIKWDVLRFVRSASERDILSSVGSEPQ